MSTARDINLSPSQLALKLATREAFKAAGGQDFCASELGCAQSRLSDYASPNTGDFISIDKVLMVEALGAGKAGHPHITRALARASGGEFLDRSADDGEAEALDVHLPRFAAEAGDLIRHLAQGVALKGRLTTPQLHELNRQVVETLDALLALYGDLNDVPAGTLVSRQLEMPLAAAALIPIRRTDSS
ncbi:hypothetical protein DXH95_02965 [Sphingorhabdus pulchriflava]|uniref:Phage regulatory protein CII (CP76) n=1 Tax=Sphingorhabdus pulchriflava TaxID=2292257 RepID=A0A371BFM4_9SPHN|nr:hypothetical protein [Sphingorhabdus pulchriflava]RDV06402.1 hypothetical protein DXH95_02965 [Sphingorhabdus pulchriflava]